MKLSKSLIILVALAMGVITFAAAKVMAVNHTPPPPNGTCQTPINGVCPA